MKNGRILVASLFSLCAGQAFASDWNNNEVAYWYGTDFKEPGVATGNGTSRDIPKNIVTLTHADGFGWLDTFLNIDVLKSTSGDPASSATYGATEVYVVDRQDFSFGKIFDTQAFHVGPIRDVMVEVGADINTKNTAFDPFKRMPVAGLAAQIDVPAGFWKVALLWDKEWNQNRLAGTNVTFDSTARAETAWFYPFAISTAHLSFEGYALINGPKGNDGFGDKTRAEILIHPQVMLDVGAWFDAPKRLKIGGGYEYWKNKFGENHQEVPGSFATTPFLRLASDFEF